MNTKKWMTFVAGFITGLIIIHLWGLISNNNSVDSPVKVTVADDTAQTQDDTIINETTGGTDTTDVIQVSDQTAGGAVKVVSVSMPQLGWVVIHEIKDGVIANALGASLRDSGEHNDIDVYLLRDTVSGGEYAVVLYQDDGDREFSLALDAPITDSSGNFIMSRFNTE
jgi:hypothetical protein